MKPKKPKFKINNIIVIVTFVFSLLSLVLVSFYTYSNFNENRLLKTELSKQNDLRLNLLLKQNKSILNLTDKTSHLEDQFHRSDNNQIYLKSSIATTTTKLNDLEKIYFSSNLEQDLQDHKKLYLFNETDMKSSISSLEQKQNKLENDLISSYQQKNIENEIFLKELDKTDSEIIGLSKLIKLQEALLKNALMTINTLQKDLENQKHTSSSNLRTTNDSIALLDNKLNQVKGNTYEYKSHPLEKDELTAELEKTNQTIHNLTKTTKFQENLLMNAMNIIKNLQQALGNLSDKMNFLEQQDISQTEDVSIAEDCPKEISYSLEKKDPLTNLPRYSKGIIVTIKPSYFLFQDSELSKIYKSGSYMTTGEIDFPLNSKNFQKLHFFSSISYLYKKGSLSSHEKTELTLLPITVGLKYIYPLSLQFNPYIKLGPNWTYFETVIDSKPSKERIEKNNLGFSSGLGNLIYIGQNFSLDLFSTYLYSKKSIKNIDSSYLGGLEFGASLAYQF